MLNRMYEVGGQIAILKCALGCMGGSVVERLPSVQGVILDSQV